MGKLQLQILNQGAMHLLLQHLELISINIISGPVRLHQHCRATCLAAAAESRAVAASCPF
jgi:hypothetical protein